MAKADSRVIYVKVAPPATHVTIGKPICPYQRGVWIQGRWMWQRGRHVWIDGHWARAKKNHLWSDGFWKSYVRLGLGARALEKLG